MGAGHVCLFYTVARRSATTALGFRAPSAATVIGLAFALAAADDVPAVLRVWGAWAIVAGLVQLFLALKRGGATSTRGLAGYAALGGLLFLISAVRLLRAGQSAEHHA